MWQIRNFSARLPHPERKVVCDPAIDADPHLQRLAGTGVLNTRVLAPARKAFGEHYTRHKQQQISDFAALGIEEQTLAPIRARLELAITRVQIFQAWRAVAKMALRDFRWLALQAGNLTVLAGIAWFLFTAPAQPMRFWVLLSIPIFLLIALIANVPYKSVSTRVWIQIILMVAIMVFVKPKFGLDVQIGLFAGVVYMAINVVGLLFAQAVAQISMRRKIGLFPEDEILQTLCYTLAYVSANQGKWPNAECRSSVVQQIEWIARRLEQEFPRQFAVSGGKLDDGLLQNTSRMAAALRRLEQCVALPNQSSLDHLQTTLRNALVTAASGRWGEMETADQAAEPATPRQKIATWSRLVLVVAGALAALALVTWGPFGLPTEFKQSLSGLLLTFVAATILGGVDPKNFEARIASERIG